MSYYENPDPGIMRGRENYVSPGGTINFLILPATKPEANLDLNWRRLQNMVKPIVDKAPRELAMSGIWENQPMALHLGMMMVDNKHVRIDKTHTLKWGRMMTRGTWTIARRKRKKGL
jgi:hypothetical protein